jgi:hypothetical protein
MVQSQPAKPMSRHLITLFYNALGKKGFYFFMGSSPPHYLLPIFSFFKGPVSFSALV